MRAVDEGWAGQGDEALLVAIGCGDADALAALYGRYGGEVRGLANRIVRDPGAAEDIAQDVFLGIWQAAGRFDPARGTPRNWLLAIAHHRAISHWRRAAVRTRRCHPLDALEGLGAAGSARDMLDAAMQARALHDGLAAIPPEQGHAIKLVYLDGHTQGAVAAAVGVPVGTVKGRVRLGLRKLRGLLDESGEVLRGVPLPVGAPR